MARRYLLKPGVFHRDVRLYLISTAAMGFSYLGVYSLLFNLYLLRLGYGPESVGLVNGVGSLTYALSALPAGALGRRWGSRRTMIAGTSLTVVALGLVPLTDLLPGTMQAG